MATIIIAVTLALVLYGLSCLLRERCSCKTIMWLFGIGFIADWVSALLMYRSARFFSLSFHAILGYLDLAIMTILLLVGLLALLRENSPLKQRFKQWLVPAYLYWCFSYGVGFYRYVIAQ